MSNENIPYNARPSPPASEAVGTELYKLTNQKLHLERGKKRHDHERRLKKLEVDKATNIFVSQQEASTRIGLAKIQLETDLCNAIAARNKKQRSFWSRLKPSSPVQSLPDLGRCFHSPFSCRCFGEEARSTSMHQPAATQSTAPQAASLPHPAFATVDRAAVPPLAETQNQHRSPRPTRPLPTPPRPFRRDAIVSAGPEQVAPTQQHQQHAGRNSILRQYDQARSLTNHSLPGRFDNQVLRDDAANANTLTNGTMTQPLPPDQAVLSLDPGSFVRDRSEQHHTEALPNSGKPADHGHSRRSSRGADSPWVVDPCAVAPEAQPAGNPRTSNPLQRHHSTAHLRTEQQCQAWSGQPQADTLNRASQGLRRACTCPACLRVVQGEQSPVQDNMSTKGNTQPKEASSRDAYPLPASFYDNGRDVPLPASIHADERVVAHALPPTKARVDSRGAPSRTQHCVDSAWSASRGMAVGDQAGSMDISDMSQPVEVTNDGIYQAQRSKATNTCEQPEISANTQSGGINMEAGSANEERVPPPLVPQPYLPGCGHYFDGSAYLAAEFRIPKRPELRNLRQTFVNYLYAARNEFLRIDDYCDDHEIPADSRVERELVWRLVSALADKSIGIVEQYRESLYVS